MPWRPMLLSVILTAACASGEPTQPATDDPVVQWLDRLEQRGREIRFLQAKIVHIKTDELLGDRQTRTGELYFLLMFFSPSACQ